VYWKIEKRENLTEVEQKFLLNLLYRISVSAVALNIVAGVGDKRGRKTNGMKGLQVARDVRSAILSGLTVEKAWEQVAETNHLSVSMVKRHWSTWKDTELRFRERSKELLASGYEKLKQELSDRES
jgi:hypothetical protein